MARQRVSALFMRDEDLEAVADVIDDATVSGHVVVGDVEEEQIGALRDAGLFIQQLEPSAEPPLPAPAAPAPAWPRLESLGPGAGAEAPAAAEPHLPASRDVYIVGVAGALLPDWVDQLEGAGAELLERVADNAYTCRIDLGRLATVRALGFVRDLRHYSDADTLHEEQLTGAAPPPAEPQLFDVVLHASDGADAVRQWLADNGVELVGSSGRKVRVRAQRGSGVLGLLARRPEVAAIDEWVPPTLSNDRARVLLGVAPDNGGTPPRWTGRGQRVGVADSGIDAEHPDLAGRLAAVFARGVPGDPSDRHGHGTHVAGSIAGNGQAVKGTAPEAELVFQSVMDAGGGLGGLPLDLAELFEEARQSGARIHNNSWGALARSAYRTSSLEVDAYVHEHPDMLVVVAAGNNATALSPRNAQPGFVDLFSLDAPATAKNALTVGASRSDRAWTPPITWGQFDPGRFADSPIADAPVTGDPGGIAAFSGRGPCQELARMKPDVVAPGTFILSTRASTAPDGSFWAPESDRYAYMGGTSMATPLVSGCAALVRQFYVEDRGHEPSAALLKATLINGTRWLGGSDATADHGFEPNFHQGFGMVDLGTTLPGDRLARLEFKDGWGDDAQAPAFTGDARTFVFGSNGGPLRMCLAWTDLPGRGLQNSLALLVRHDGSGKRESGNPRRKKEFDTEDAANNVQVIRWDDAPVGDYVVQVTAGNLLPRSAGAQTPPQHFALVVSGDLTSELTAV